MSPKHAGRIRSRSLVRSAHSLATFLSTAGLLALLSGCSVARPDPAQSFDEITRRSLNDDGPYVRARLAPSYIAAAKAPQADPQLTEFVRGLMAQLQLCRSISVATTDDPNKVTVEAACVQGGSIQQSKFDLVYDAKTGWMLAAPPRETQPLQKTPSKP